VLRTLELLDKSKVIKEYEILDFKQGEDFYFLKKSIFIRIIGRTKMVS